MLISRELHRPVANCTQCNLSLDAGAWSRLVLIEQLDREGVRHLLTAWPWSLDAFLEVRRCRCGGTVARLVGK